MMMRAPVSLLLLLAAAAALLGSAQAKVYFHETFNEESWRLRWTVPTQWHDDSKMGEWGWTAGTGIIGDEEDKGIQTNEDARFWGLSAVFDEPFDNEDKDIVLQFSVKHEQKLDCGGGYIKLLGTDFDQDAFGGETPYKIMFGPDICGQTKKTQIVLHEPVENTYVVAKKETKCETDDLSHLYTLWISPEDDAPGHYKVYIDGEVVREGGIRWDWNLLKEETILDPDASKPDDWVDEKKMPDPDAVKPEGWDDIPPEIPDPDAEKPEDWDDEEDGEWEPPMIDNPEYKGEWTPPMIDNPEYQGIWRHPRIDNPEYVPNEHLYHRCDPCGGIGFELWQVKSGTIFDDILVTDSIEEANQIAQETFWVRANAEKAAQAEEQERQRKEDEARREEERKRREEEEARKAEEGEEEEEELEEEEHSEL